MCSVYLGHWFSLLALMQQHTNSIFKDISMSFRYYVLLEISLCVYVGIVLHVYRFVCVPVGMEVRDQYWVSFSITSHLIFWDKFAHWAWSFALTGWSASPWDLFVSVSPPWDYKFRPMCLAFMCVLGIQTQVLKLMCFTKEAIWHFSSSETLCGTVLAMRIKWTLPIRNTKGFRNPGEQQTLRLSKVLWK